MNTLVLGNKKYVLIGKKEFEMLQIKAAQKVEPAKKLSLSKGKDHAYKLIESWAKGK